MDMNSVKARVLWIARGVSLSKTGLFEDFCNFIYSTQHFKCYVYAIEITKTFKKTCFSKKNI